ncbi:MAG: hypothetical protein ABI693_25725 [Bryobacteraceae bacterium]
MVIALAGRRIDAEGAEPRFPAANAAQVKSRIASALEELGARALVSSAACGADILGQEAARDARLTRRVVLPFARHEFRKTSVADRGGDWAARFDRLMEDVETIVLDFDPGAEGAYAAANHAILDEAVAMATDFEQMVTALIVWNGQSRGEDDLTKAFADEARRRGMQLVEVLTT